MSLTGLRHRYSACRVSFSSWNSCSNELCADGSPLLAVASQAKEVQVDEVSDDEHFDAKRQRRKASLRCSFYQEHLKDELETVVLKYAFKLAAEDNHMLKSAVIDLFKRDDYFKFD